MNKNGLLCRVTSRVVDISWTELNAASLQLDSPQINRAKTEAILIYTLHPALNLGEEEVVAVDLGLLRDIAHEFAPRRSKALPTLRVTKLRQVMLLGLCDLSWPGCDVKDSPELIGTPYIMSGRAVVSPTETRAIE